MFCSQAADPGDIIGLPRFNEETGKTEFALPWWFPTDNTPVVLFLDELNRARPEILQVVMDLTLSRKLAGKTLPAGSQVISAINEGDEYQLTDLDPALVSRFNVYNFVPTPADWIYWATRSGIDSRVISFISTNAFISSSLILITHFLLLYLLTNDIPIIFNINVLIMPISFLVQIVNI